MLDQLVPSPITYFNDILVLIIGSGAVFMAVWIVTQNIRKAVFAGIGMLTLSILIGLTLSWLVGKLWIVGFPTGLSFLIAFGILRQDTYNHGSKNLRLFLRHFGVDNYSFKKWLNVFAIVASLIAIIIAVETFHKQRY
jgi:hypothetical protein